MSNDYNDSKYDGQTSMIKIVYLKNLIYHSIYYYNYTIYYYEAFPTNGVITLPLSEPNVGFVIVVAVAKDELVSYYTQLLQVVSSIPHDVNIV